MFRIPKIPQPTDCSVGLLFGIEAGTWLGHFPLLSTDHDTHRRGINCPTSRLLTLSFGAVLASRKGSFLKDPWLVLGDVFPDVFNPNMIVCEFISSHMNFLHNELVKPDKTCIDTQGCFKLTLSNVMDILGRLTSKLHET